MFNFLNKAYLYVFSKIFCLNLYLLSNVCIIYNVYIIIYRYLVEEIRGEYSDRFDKGVGVDDFVVFVKEIILYNM